MAETLTLPQGAGKVETYTALLPQIESVIAVTPDMIANMANVAAMLKAAFDFHWVGFYRTVEPGLLRLGPFQGPLACVDIPFTKGVCGKAARDQATIIVPDVEAFPGHIACSSLSKSEIVVPGVVNGETAFVLDLDSDRLDDFDAVDQEWLEKLVTILIKASN
ncbi:MAG TPA: GAF domain-containing protein [Patescibacteria group bacterium]|nr:GAF domain-containing protein [Patescibacteria group bacterium]